MGVHFEFNQLSQRRKEGVNESRKLLLYVDQKVSYQIWPEA